MGNDRQGRGGERVGKDINSVIKNVFCLLSLVRGFLF